MSNEVELTYGQFQQLISVLKDISRNLEGINTQLLYIKNKLN